MSLPPLFPRGCSSGPLEPQGWDRVVLGGFVLPGRAKVTRGSLKVKADKKSAAGKNGGKSTTHGLEQQEVEVQVVVWTDEQLERLETYCNSLLPYTGAPNPVSIESPALAILGITKVTITGASLLADASSPKGGKQMTFNCLQWQPEKKAAASSSVTNTPTRSVRNKRSEDAARRSNPAPSANPETVKP